MPGCSKTSDESFDKSDASLEKIEYLRTNLLGWYQKHGRRYPWRVASDPYKILIAEIMLRRTKADLVLPVYQRFMHLYPNIQSLSMANEEDIQRICAPLGLGLRNMEFRNLALLLTEKYQREIPREREELVNLPGVGEYVADAFLVGAYNQKQWIVDANVVKVLSRFFGLEFKGDGRRDKGIIELANKYIDWEPPKVAVFAIIDFAALVCKNHQPEHSRCFVCEKCVYFREQTRNTRKSAKVNV
jgi:A/G-specific adenine glycosylase